MSLIVNFLTSPTAGNFVQNSTAQVLSEGCLKAVGRPVFTLMDKTAEDQQKNIAQQKNSCINPCLCLHILHLSSHLKIIVLDF